jgi:aryl-alcohol dehydrogenase-like predicted oxidoreductase
LVPYIIHQLRIELEGCLGAANPDTQTDLISLLEQMIDDFNSRWGEELSYSHQTRRGDRNRQMGIHAYSYWAMALDPRTKKYLPKILMNQQEIRRLWKDIEESCLEEARATGIPRVLNDEEDVDVEVGRIEENPIV